MSSDEPDFSTPKKFIRSGFNRIASGLKLPWFTSGRLYAAFEAAHISGDPAKEKAAIAAVLRDKDWRWPWLESCAADFQKRGIWPVAWKDIDIRSPLDWQNTPPAVWEQALLRTLTAAVYSDRNADQLADAIREIPSWKARLASNGTRCKAEAHAIASHRAQIAKGDFRHLPPYFPLDGSNLRLDDGKKP